MEHLAKQTLTLKVYIEILVNRASYLESQLTAVGDYDLEGREAKMSEMLRELRSVALQLAGIQTHSLSRTTRSDITSALVASAQFLLDSDDASRLAKLNGQETKLEQNLINARTRAERRALIQKLRHLDEERRGFFHDRLTASGKQRAKRRRKKKSYFRARRALGLGAQ